MHNHVELINLALQAGYLKEKNALTARNLRIDHDEWCSLVNGCGECDCNPVLVRLLRDARGRETGSEVIPVTLAVPVELPVPVPVTGKKPCRG